MAKHILRHRKGVREHQIIHPRRDWFIGVGLALVLFAVIATWSTASYQTFINKSIEVVTADQAQPQLYREAEVGAALDIFQEREQVFADLISSSAGTPPPVIATTTAPASISSTTEDENVPPPEATGTPVIAN